MINTLAWGTLWNINDPRFTSGRDEVFLFNSQHQNIEEHIKERRTIYQDGVLELVGVSEMQETINAIYHIPKLLEKFRQ